MKQKSHPYHIARHQFLIRLLRNIIYGIILVSLSLYLGMSGYRYLEDMPWSDAYLNAAMILSGMGPVTELHTLGGKIFAGSYAIFSGVLFIIIIGITFGPVIHWILVKFHMYDKDK